MGTADRKQAILDTAAQLIIERGFDKTTVGDVADALGLSRGLVYVHFKSKEALLDALIQREMLRYGELWLNYIESDPHGGTIGSVYRGVLLALRQTPFLAAVVTRDENTFGKYLRRPGTLLSSLQTADLTTTFLKALQDAHAIRADVNIETIAYIMDALSAGLVDSKRVAGRAAPPFEIMLDTIAEMMDRLVTPDEGGDPEAGRAVLRQFAAVAREHFIHYQQAVQKRN